MKKMALLISILCVPALLLSGCGLFDSEYLVVEDYAPTVQNESSPEDKIIVRNINSLKQAIRTIITEGDSEGKIFFDPAYDGDPVADMSKACWQVRTQDALCAYCVADISYELSKIVTYYEARLYIGYTDYVESAGSIVNLPFSTGIENVIRQTLSDGSTKVVMLVGHSSYSAEDVVGLVSEVYRQNPAVAPIEPTVSVNMYSGSNMQRLYEVNLHYGLTAEEQRERTVKLREFSPFDGMDLTGLDEVQRALLAYEYLCENSQVDSSGGKNTVYAALIGKAADSEGLAMGYLELCRQLGVECIVVYGQHEWQDHCWNIIKAEERYYHVDAGLNDIRDAELCFMKTDEDFWSTYRWDMSSYPACMPLPEPSETELVPEDEADHTADEPLAGEDIDQSEEPLPESEEEQLFTPEYDGEGASDDAEPDDVTAIAPDAEAVEN